MARGSYHRQPIPDRVLQVLCDHPFLSRRQLELYLGCTGRYARRGLAKLLQRGHIRHFNAHQPWLHTRALFAPAALGIEQAAQQVGMEPRDFSWQKGLHLARLERLAVSMQRVFQLRTILLWLGQGAVTDGGNTSWSAVAWDVEIGRFFSTPREAFWVPFHGGALFRRTVAEDTSETRWIPAVIELDLGRVAVDKDRERWLKFVMAQDDPRFYDKDKEYRFPVLVIVARDEFCLQDYYALLRALALSRRLPMPRAYLTTWNEMLTLRNDNTASIWYSTASGQRVPLLFDLEGIPTAVPDQIPWRKMPLFTAGADTTGTAALEFSDEVEHSDAGSVKQLPRLAFALLPLEKRALDEIAAHPLLKVEELALLLNASQFRVGTALARLEAFKLIEQHDDMYLLAAHGEHYLAMVAGFGNAVRRYAHARGWGRGYAMLLKHREHTRAENEFFLHLAAIARVRRHALAWLSELESRLYYEAGNRRHSFMPDGRGTYQAGNWRYEFALEIDRSRASQAKVRRKLAEYAACVNSNILRREGIELLRVLIVTNSWERADMLWDVAIRSAGGVPIFITTFDRYRASGADAAIWLRADETGEDSAVETRKVHCFECFRPKASPKDAN